MRISIILNGISLNKNTFYKKILPPLKSFCDVEVFETQTENDAGTLAAQSVVNKYDFIFAAGGDGTLHQVVNGMLNNFDVVATLPVLGIIPLGSGNDFARTFTTGDDPQKLIRALRNNQLKTIDLGEVEYSVTHSADYHAIRDKRYFINVADVGMGPDVVKKVMNSDRFMGPAFAYYKSILTTFFSYKPVMLHASSKDWEWHSLMRSFAIGNGKYYGNGLCIAPEAQLDDNKLNVFACGGVSVFDFILQSVPLKLGRKIKHPYIQYYTGTEIKLDADDPLMIEADGEILGWLPALVRMSDKKISLLMG